MTEISKDDLENKPLKLEEVCQILRLSKPTVRWLLATHQIKAAKIGRTWRISRQAVDDFLLGK